MDTQNRIPQRELRNNSGKILRDVERGKRYVVTVDGRPVAMLSPYKRNQWVSKSEVIRNLCTSVDATSFMDDIKSLEDRLDPEYDPWKK